MPGKIHKQKQLSSFITLFKLQCFAESFFMYRVALSQHEIFKFYIFSLCSLAQLSLITVIASVSAADEVRRAMNGSV